MKTFNVIKTFRNNNDNTVIENKKIGTVTAYTITKAMRNAVNKFNNGIWSNISVKIK